jgi:prepilin-type N-terminal cleavage/methylation domain-containing protein
MGRRGLTLVEVVVTVVLLVTLAAMALPAQGRAREESRRAMCASGLMQWYVGYECHAEDYDGFYPGMVRYDLNDMFCAESWVGEKFPEWSAELNRRVGDYVPGEATLCPSAVPGKDRAGLVDHWPPKGKWTMVDYWMFAGRCTYPGYPTGSGCTPDGRPLPPEYGWYKGLWQREWLWVKGDRIPRRDTDIRPTAVMFMDRSWAPKGLDAHSGKPASEFYYGIFDFGRASNHSTPGKEGLAANNIVRLAEGANALELSGAVRWMDLTGEVEYYGKDFYYRFHVDEVHKPPEGPGGTP